MVLELVAEHHDGVVCDGATNECFTGHELPEGLTGLAVRTPYGQRRRAPIRNLIHAVPCPAAVSSRQGYQLALVVDRSGRRHLELVVLTDLELAVLHLA